MQQMMNPELNAVVMPNGSFQLEWTETLATVNKSTRLLQEEIYNRFSTDTGTGTRSWLLVLGFFAHQVML